MRSSEISTYKHTHTSQKSERKVARKKTKKRSFESQQTGIQPIYSRRKTRSNTKPMPHHKFNGIKSLYCVHPGLVFTTTTSSQASKLYQVFVLLFLWSRYKRTSLAPSSSRCDGNTIRNSKTIQTGDATTKTQNSETTQCVEIKCTNEEPKSA